MKNTLINEKVAWALALGFKLCTIFLYNDVIQVVKKLLDIHLLMNTEDGTQKGQRGEPVY